MNFEDMLNSSEHRGTDEQEERWEQEARELLIQPNCQCRHCRIYVIGFIRGRRSLERAAIDAQLKAYRKRIKP